IIDRIKGRKVFVPTGYSGLDLPEYKDYFNQMRKWIHQFDMHVFLGMDYKDINFAKTAGLKKYCIITNGADEREFAVSSAVNVRSRLGISPDELLVLHVGTLTGQKGHFEALQIFLR